MKHRMLESVNKIDSIVPLTNKGLSYIQKLISMWVLLMLYAQNIPLPHTIIQIIV